MLRAAWALPVATTYAPLQSQTFSSLCGPTSVTNVLRSIQPKGVKALKGFRAMSLEQLRREAAELVPVVWHVSAVRPPTVDAFRDEMRRSNDPNCRYVVNFLRATLFGRGGGHHSPIGGYLEAEDVVMVLDVNASFGPWLVPTARLFEAASTTADPSTGLTRGLVRFERSLG